MTTKLVDYKDKYETAVLERTDGILEIRFHSDGGPWIWDEVGHREVTEIFRNVADDRENRVVILTGTGDSYLSTIRANSFPDLATMAGIDTIFYEGRRQIEALLSIECPVIAAINGDCRVHCELPLLSDIVIASETTTFQDVPHFPNGIIPGDGVNIWALEVLGANRGRYFLMMGEEMSAQEAQRLGAVGEVVPADQVLPRAREIAATFAQNSDLMLRYSRIILTQHWKEKFLKQQGYGMMMSSIAVTDMIATRMSGGAESPMPFEDEG